MSNITPLFSTLFSNGANGTDIPMFAMNQLADQLKSKKEQDMAFMQNEARKGRMRSLEQTIMDASSKQPCYSRNTAAHLRFLATRNVWEQATDDEENSDHQAAMESLKMIMSTETVNNWVTLNKKKGMTKQQQLGAFSTRTYWTFPYLRLKSWSTTRTYLVNVLKKLLSSCVSEPDDPDDIKDLTRKNAGVLLDRMSSNQTGEQYNDLEQRFFDGVSHTMAEERGVSELTKYCLFGGDLHRRDNQGYTLLHRAVACDAVDCARILIEEGVDVNLPTTRSRHTGNGTASTALHLACMHQSHRMVALICQEGERQPQVLTFSFVLQYFFPVCNPVEASLKC